MTEEEKGLIIEENSKLISFRNVALRLNEFTNSIELKDFIEYVNKSTKNGNEVTVSLYDALVESDQSFVIDVGFGVKAQNIILTSINMKNERISKINRFFDIIEEINMAKDSTSEQVEVEEKK